MARWLLSTATGLSLPHAHPRTSTEGGVELDGEANFASVDRHCELEGVRILGLDPGLATLGYGCIEVQGNTCQVCDFGVITTPADAPVGDRLQNLYTDLHTLIPTLQPDWVALERLFFYKMSHTIVVAQARGVILLVLSQLHCPLLEFTPPPSQTSPHRLWQCHKNGRSTGGATGTPSRHPPQAG